jgi:acyl-CoA synthetase (AMP-forming)/AMP-acid ligase II
MIVSAGESSYPREIEEVLIRHHAITDVAVVGVPHQTWKSFRKSAKKGSEICK